MEAMQLQVKDEVKNEVKNEQAESFADGSPGVQGSAGVRHTLRGAVFKKGQEGLQVVLPNSKCYLHTDCNSIMEHWVGKLPEEKEVYATCLKNLHDKVVQVTHGVRPDEPQSQRIVPPLPTGAGATGMRVMVPLYQVGYEHNMGMKGPSAATDVFDCVHKFLLDQGNETHLYPIQALYCMNGPLEIGKPVVDFSVGLNVGFAVTTACHMICHTFLTTIPKEDWMNDSWWSQDEEHVHCAEKMRRVLRLHASWCPRANLEEQVFAAISSKKHAALRQPPNLIQMMYACHRIITYKRSQGSRKSIIEMINEWLKMYNKKETLTRARLTTDEQKGMKFLIRMTDEFVVMLKSIWNADKLHRTAVPLNLLCEKFLAVDAEPPVNKDQNPLWHGICGHSKEKYLAWLQRANGKFEHGLEERLAATKHFNLENQAHLLRDKTDDRELVFRMSQLWVASTEHRVEVNSSERVQELEKMWVQGLLDSDLRPHANCMDKDFKFTMLRFCRAEVEEIPRALVDLGEQAREALKTEAIAGLETVKLQLAQDQANFRTYQQAAKAWETQQASDKKDLLNSAQTAIRETRKSVMKSRFQVEGFHTFKQSKTYMKQALTTVAEMDPPTKPTDVIRVNVFDLAKYGQSHSRYIKDFDEIITAECREHPVTACCVVLPPHVPAWGESLESRQRDKLIDEARKVAFRKFREASNNVIVKKITLLLHRDCQGPNSSQKLARKALLILSAELENDGVTLKSIFRNSAMFKDEAVPEFLRILARNEYRNWAQTVDAADKTNLGSALERCFWNSGRGFYGPLFRSLFQGMKLGAHNRAQIRDWSLWDDEVAHAVMEHHMSPGVPFFPELFYAGVVKDDTKRSTTIASEVRASIEQELDHNLEHKKYKVPGFTPQSPADIIASMSANAKPAFQGTLNVTFLRADNTLAMKEIAHRKHIQALSESGADDHKAEFEKILKAHNDEFNPTGKLWVDGKRLNPDGHGEEPPNPGPAVSEDAVTIVPKAEDARSVDDLKAKGKVIVVDGAKDFYENYFGEDGAWYIKAAGDGIIDSHTKMGTLKGKYKTGAAAQAVIADGGTHYVLAITGPECLVCVSTSGNLPDGKTLPAHPTKIHDILKLLEASGKVNPIMPHHKIETDGDTYKLACEETISLEVKSEARAKKFSIANIGGVCDLESVKESPYISLIPSFEYQPKKNKFVPQYPGVWPTKGMSVKNENFLKIS